ncbi:MAG TPA: tRNA preQ1(34) S-adenosylmethionine ribosyltransferase-isomerase QueA [Xanthomonadaceae bacterium]|nr:tRNA preQ1(34) S-adenosylmethionine ribosyltransferase-isomerase QueA [Xanthomonadaceae bacterium]
MKKSDFHYELPGELIAQQPLPERSASRLLVLPPRGEPEDRAIVELPGQLAPGDLLVFNDTRVIPARLSGSKDSGGRVEILVERVLGTHEVRAQLRASKSPGPGSRIDLGDGTLVTVLGRDGEFYLLHFDCTEPVERVLLRLGRVPLPPYIRRGPTPEDAERYQTVFAREAGAVAAPTAGLHFDEPLLAALHARGIETGTVTLHVGAGTFQPMRGERIQDHVMHSEWLEVGADLCAKIAATRSRGGRVVAVGTTVVRALETAWHEDCVRPFAGETRIFIFPGKPVRSIDALLTNFHLPESTLLMLVCAFGGRERVLSAYRHAVSRRYRFFSYGDAMLVFPEAAR